MREIDRAWQRREDRLRAGRFDWSEVAFLNSGALLKADDPFNSTGRAVPPKSVTQEYRRSLLFAGNSLRFSDNEPKWVQRQESFLTVERVSTWNGEIGKSLRRRHGITTNEFSGRVLPHARDIVSERSVEPLLLYCRPSHLKRRSANVLDRFRLVDANFVSDSKSFVVLEESAAFSGPSGAKVSMWLDPAQDYCLAKYLLEHQGRIVEELDVSYTDDPVHGPVISRWKRVDHNKEGVLQRAVTATVQKFDINPKPAASDFDVDFPIGTLVLDVTSGQEQEYIVRDDGQHRAVTREELLRGASFEDLLKTESGRAKLAEASAAHQWPFLVGGIALLGALLFLARRSRKK